MAWNEATIWRACTKHGDDRVRRRGRMRHSGRVASREKCEERQQACDRDDTAGWLQAHRQADSDRFDSILPGTFWWTRTYGSVPERRPGRTGSTGCSKRVARLAPDITKCATLACE
jgi:hypothetical protein